MGTKFREPAMLAVSVLTLYTLSSFLPVVVSTRNTASADSQSQSKPTLQRSESRAPQGQGREDDGAIILNTALVLLDVTVVDPANKPVRDLTKDNFQILENKEPQKIDFFSRDQVPVSLAFVIDTSGSMRSKLDTVIKAATNIVKESRADDEMAVVQFKDQPELLEEFTGDTRDVIDTLQSLVASRQTAMLDALYLAANYAAKEGKNRRKAVLVVTDGLDNDSYYKFNDVVDQLRETDVQVYLIGFTSDLDNDSGLFRTSTKNKAERLLTKLADETGGKAFFPKELNETHAIAEQISIDLRTQYSIGYYPTNLKKDGTFRAVRVQISAGDRRLVARTRNGYTAPRDTANNLNGNH